MRRILTVFLLIALPAGAYYHYVHYTSHTGPYNPVPEKFDLSALPAKTLTFFVSDEGPVQYQAGDNFASVLSQVQEAARVWNSVSTSDLRVAFGGLFTPGTPQSAPGGEIVFEEMPPGLLGLGGPTARADLAQGPGGYFIPITRAVVRLNRDLTQRPGPSYSEAFFLTTLHEMGHALGLQHTLTSSTMATDVTQATSRAKPLDDDDIAGLSLLYPARGFAERFGSISGRVTLGGQGIHLASVVAIHHGGGAISALTNPDGSYRIDGIPPGQYLVYAHPLPPPTQSGLGPANLVLPTDPDFRQVSASEEAFEAVFFPGTRQAQNAVPVSVSSGNLVEDVSFSVQPRSGQSIYGVTTYSFYGQMAVKPGYLNVGSGSGTVVAYGAGLTPGGGVAPGLGVTLLDGSAALAPGSFRAYGTPAFLAFDLLFNFASGTGPRHLVFSNPNGIYVLPSGIHLVQKQPPSIYAAALMFEDGRPLVNIAGENLSAETRFYFDGLRAPVRSVNKESGIVTVVPPPAPGGYQAVISAVNPDGQSSMFLQSQSPPTFSYEFGDQPVVYHSPAALPAGSQGLIEIAGVNTGFTEGQTVVGFGSSDVTVRRVFVLSPTSMLVNVAVSPNAQPGATQASVISGFQVSSQPFGFQVLPANPRLPVLNVPLVNAATALPGVSPGSVAVLTGANLAALGATGSLTLRDMKEGKDVPLTILAALPEQVSFQIPANFPIGPTILKFSNGMESALPIAVMIEAPPPVITSIAAAAGDIAAASRSLRAGESLTIFVSGLSDDPAGDVAAGKVKVEVGGVAHTVLPAVDVQAPEGSFAVVIALSPLVAPGSEVPVTVSVGTRVSQAFLISVVQ